MISGDRICLGEKHSRVSLNSYALHSLMNITLFDKVKKFNLRDRFKPLSQNDDQIDLLIYTEGFHDSDEINRYMSQVSILNIGYFDPQLMEIVLVDLFSRGQINFSKNKMPNYLILSR